MNSTSELILVLASSAGPGDAPISLTNALLVLFFGGLLVAAYQLNRVAQRLAALERRLHAARSEPSAPAAPTALPPRGDDTPTPEILAAIVAACHVQLGGRARIVSITDPADLKQVWSLEGRRQIFASHQPR